MSTERFSFQSPIGYLDILTQDNVLTQLNFAHEKQNYPETKSAFGKHIRLELMSYFSNSQHIPDIPYQLLGSAFQQNTWQTLTSIPVGQTLTYGELAKRLKSSPRAIGQACRKNPIPIIAPCHRVIGANHLGGFVGKTKGAEIDIKTWLLKHEGYTK